MKFNYACCIDVDDSVLDLLAHLVASGNELDDIYDDVLETAFADDNDAYYRMRDSDIYAKVSEEVNNRVKEIKMISPTPSSKVYTINSSKYGKILFETFGNLLCDDLLFATKADAANFILDKVSPAVLAAHFNRYEAVSTVYELTELSDLKSFIMECVVTPVTVYSYGAD